MEFSSKLIESAVTEIAKLPGIGKKTALRLVLHLLKSDPSSTTSLTEALTRLREDINYCEHCFNISDESVCSICSSVKRDQSTICVVEDIRDILAIENTGQYHGLYHVLGGVISPMNGIGPTQLNIEALLTRVEDAEVLKEVIFALSPTMEGDTTTYYISKKLKAFEVNTSSIARGIPIGGELEYTDEITLGRSILTRIQYKTEE